MSNLTSAVDELVGTDLTSLALAMVEEEFFDISVAIERLQAARLARLAVLDGAGVGDADHGGSTAGWVREMLTCAPTAASRDVHLARDLSALPKLGLAVAEGRISLEHARVIAGLRKDLPDDAVRAAVPNLIEAAQQVNPIELRRWVLTVRDGYSPDKRDLRDIKQYEQRSLSAASTFQGMGVGSWTLHPVGHETVMTAIHAFSAPISGDDRSPAQRRADALITIAEIALGSGQAEETGGIKPHVTVVVDLETLEDRAGAPAATYGFGTISSPQWARRMCCDAGISRVITDGPCEILDSGRTTRTFSASQRRAIIVRDGHCSWPGCDMPAAWCDVHHREHWTDGGATSVANGVLACGRHHDRVHLHEHAIIIDPDGRRRIDIRPGSARDQSGADRDRDPGSDPDPPPSRLE